MTRGQDVCDTGNEYPMCLCVHFFSTHNPQQNQRISTCRRAFFVAAVRQFSKKPFFVARITTTRYISYYYVYYCRPRPVFKSSCNCGTCHWPFSCVSRFGVRTHNGKRQNR